MKKIAFFTTSRADFGQQYPLLKELQKHKDCFQYYLFAGGSHFSQNAGYTIQEIKSQHRIDEEFNFYISNRNVSNTLKELGDEFKQLSIIFNKFNFDIIVLFGDRYELIPIALAAITYDKLIIHIHGGERSEGVMDEQIRHMLTKSAHLHFVSCEQYASNVRKMGEEKHRVYNTGALSSDVLHKLTMESRKDLFKKLNIDYSKKTVLFTYHPTRLESNQEGASIVRRILSLLEEENLQVVITGSNSDYSVNLVREEIKNTTQKNEDFYYFNSLGIKNYLNLVQHCEFVIGNSSSGITEVPYFKIPTINIGDRQKGRFMHRSIIDVSIDYLEMKNAIKQALSEDFRDSLKDMRYELGDGNTAKKMATIMDSLLLEDVKSLKVKKLEFPC